MKRILLAAVSTVALAAAAHAQEMDYGQLSEVFGEAVTMSATGSPQRATEVPADMEIITAEDIRRSGAHNLPDLLQNIPGMDVRQYSRENSEINVRGEIQTTTPRLLVLVNGRQVYLDYFGYVPWSSIPVQMSEIRQIEVVKGPGTALFGFNAYSGVINIITYSPLKDDVTTLQGQYGTQAYRRGSAVITHHFLGDTLGVKLSAGATQEHDLGKKPDDRLRSISADVRWQVQPNIELSLEGTRADTKDFELSSLYNFGNIQYGTTSVRAGILADTALGLISAEGYNNHAIIKKHLGTIDLVYSNDLISSKVSDLFKIGTDHTVRVSLEYRDASNNVTSPATPGARIGERVWSGAAMWNWQINPKLALTNSVRLDRLGLYWDGPYPTLPVGAPSLADYNNKTQTTLSYNSGLVYKLTGVDTFRILAGRGVQVPSLLAYSYIGNAGTAAMGAAPYAIHLNPSYQDSVEVGYDRRIDEINSTLRFTAFHLVSTNLLQYAKVNGGSSIENGIEIQLKGKSASGFRWNASYAFKDVSDHVNMTVSTNLINFQDGTPKSRLIAGLGYSFDKFELDVDGRWQSQYVDWYAVGFSATPHPTTIKSYFTLNARVAYKVTDYLWLAVSGTQLTAPTQIQTAGYPVERRLFFTTNLDL